MATRVVEGKKPYTGGKAISIDENKVISLNLRDENNLIIYDSGDDEIYVDLQLPDGITPTDAFPVGVTTGRAVVDNGWDKAGTIISAKTTSGDEIKILYADDGTLWMDNGTGTFKQIYFKADVDAIAQAIWDYIYANCNTKTFYDGTMSMSLAQELYDWISQGNYGIVYFNPLSGIKRDVIFPPTTRETGTISSWSYTDIRQAVGGMFYEDLITLEFGVSDGVVTTGINRRGSVINNGGRLILSQPTEPSNPIEGTTWYDTTSSSMKVWDGTQWNATGGEIVYSTQAEYNALLPGALTDNKHYFIYSTSGGGGWQPGANCVAYYPFDTDTNDAVGTTTFTVTDSGIALAQISGVNALYNNGSGTSNIDLSYTRADVTSVFVRVKGDGVSPDATLIGERRASGGYDQHRTIDVTALGKWNITRWDSNSYTISTSVDVGTGWTCIGYIEKSTGADLYINGVFIGSSVTPSTWEGLTYNVGVMSWVDNGATGRCFKGYMSKLVLYNAEKSEADYLAYYDQTKADYGL